MTTVKITDNKKIFDYLYMYENGILTNGLGADEIGRKRSGMTPFGCVGFQIC